MRVALGVSGGVAAYKAAELVRRLQQEGIDVQVVMTKSAQEFVTPLTFAALTGQKVITEMFGDDTAGAEVERRHRPNAVPRGMYFFVLVPPPPPPSLKIAPPHPDPFFSS